MYAYSYYQAAIDSDNISDVENYLKKALEVCNNRIKDKDMKQELLTFKLRIFYNLGEVFLRDFKQTNDELSKQKAGEYLKEGMKCFKINKQIFSKQEQKEIETDGPIKDILDLLNELH